MHPRTASCSCGQLHLQVSAEPVRVSVCHCLNCQRRTGGVFAAQARFPASAVRIHGTATEFVLVGDSGGRAVFRFCPTCGATVYYTLEGRGDVIAVPVGAFADPTFPAPTVSVYEDRKHTWVTMPQDIEHWA